MKMTLEEQLELGISVAREAFKGYVDKGGHDYILHPLQVMNSVSDIKEKIVAVLHDIVEDTPITLSKLTELGFDADIVEAVDAITKRQGESYDQYLYRVYINPLARNVKIKDILTNSDLTRIPSPTEKDFKRVEKYNRATSILTEDNWCFDGTSWTLISQH